jgi:hypothetical protein
MKQLNAKDSCGHKARLWSLFDLEIFIKTFGLGGVE